MGRRATRSEGGRCFQCGGYLPRGSSRQGLHPAGKRPSQGRPCPQVRGDHSQIGGQPFAAAPLRTCGHEVFGVPGHAPGDYGGGDSDADATH